MIQNDGGDNVITDDQMMNSPNMREHVFHP